VGKYLYEVNFNRGKSNPEYDIFYRNVTELNAKSPDYTGINNLCVISHHMDRNTVYGLCANGLNKSRNDLSVVEITKKTLAASNSAHRLLTDLIDDYFLPHGDYPNI
jgi:hypothetical protein